MKYITKTLTNLVLSLALSATLAYADVAINPNAGTTSATFLKYGIGSRAVAMGTAFSALDNDVSALYWNPAGLAQLENNEIGITHNESFEGIRHDFAGYAFPFKHGVLAGAVYGLYTPNDNERRSGLFEDDPYEPISSIEGYFRAYDIAGHLSYARWFNRNLSLGVSVKFIQQTIDTYNATGGAVDFGSLYKFSNIPLSLALSVQNIGTPIKFINTAYDLPINFRFGSAYKFGKKLTATLDVNQPNDDYLSVSAGTEYSPIELFSVRAGYSYRTAGPELGDLYGFSAGVGLNFKLQNTVIMIDYAFVPYSVLGNAQLLSVSIVFPNMHAKKQPLRVETPSGAPQPDSASAKPPAPPQLPKDTAPISQSSLISSDYDVFAANVKIRRRLASGRQSIYILSGKTTGSDLVSLEGSIKTTMKGVSMEVGEKKGEGNVYKHFVIQSNLNAPVYRASYNIRVPKNLSGPAVKTEEGEAIEIQKDSEDADYVYYSFSTDQLKPFRVEHK